jgi:uncharacterized protein (TIGR03000 family)
MGPPPGAPKGEEKLPPPDKKTATSGPARLLVEMPADGKLYVDDQLMKTAAERREFNTPVLEKGSTYYYELRVEIVRDGKPVSQTRRILVKAGERIRASFSEESILAAAGKDKVATAGADAGR